MKNLKHFLSGILFLVLMVNLGSCGSSDDVSPPPPLAKTGSITRFSALIPGQKTISLIISQENLTIENNDSLPYGTNVTNIISTFILDREDASLNVKNVVQETGVTANDFSNPVVYDFIIDGKSIKKYTVKLKVKKSEGSAKSFQSFQFKESGIIKILFHIDDETKTITNKDLVPSDVNASALKAYFTKEETSKVTINGVEQISGKTVNDFTKPVVYRITALDGTYEEYTVDVKIDPFTYFKNPVLRVDSPDPTVIRGEDGYFYMYGTGHTTPIHKSADLVNWEYVGEAFTNASRPTFVKDAGIWAPDINYIDGKYVLYYAMSVWGGEWSCGIGVAVADKPEGPFSTIKNQGKMFISTEIGVQNSIDCCIFEEGGTKYMFWGSFSGIYATKLTDDGLAVADMNYKVRLAGNWFEASYIHKRNGYYYMFASIGSCCEGANSKYRVVVGRSESLLGPYVNKAGEPMIHDNFELLLQGDSQFKGPGHHSSIITDDNGDEWILYHTYHVNMLDKNRMVALDKITWTDDWPTISNGYPSKVSHAPVFGKKK